jgi:hypothetical protein
MASKKKCRSWHFNLGKILKNILFAVCIGFLLRQAILCISRYLAEETTMSMEILRNIFFSEPTSKVGSNTFVETIRVNKYFNSNLYCSFID